MIDEQRVEEAKKEYRSRFPEVADDHVRVLVGPDDSLVVGNDVYKWLRFHQDESIEQGILWGGDVWEPANLQPNNKE